MSRVLDFFVNSYRTPPFLLPIYLAAAERYGVPWQVLAAINEVESNYGYDVSVSSAGAEGWMQFVPTEWLAFGVDANGAGVRDPYNPADAIFAAARYLAGAGAAHDLRGAIYAYNHSSSYVESVMLRTRLIAGAPQSLISGLTAIVNGRFPVAGAGPQAATLVWAAPSRRAAARSLSVARAPSASAAALPPPPRAAAESARAAGPTLVGASVAASPGATVLAVQHAEVIRTGHSSKLGRFIELRDVFGDRYTYARLGGVARRYGTARRSAPASGAQQLRRTPPERMWLAPLRKGAWVLPGTVLGSVPGGAPGTTAHFLFEIRPAGAGPIDPRPVLQAWRLLGQTEGHPNQGTQPLFGPNAGDALIGEILLMSQRQLEVRLLSDSRLRIYTCGRSDIAAGRIDRRVLAALDFLLASGIDPTVSALECGRGSQATAASRSEHAKGDAVAVSAFSGVPIRGHHGPGSLAELAVRRLLMLPGAMRPHQIIGPLLLRGTAGTLVKRGSPDRIDIGFDPAARGRAARAPAKSTRAPRGTLPGAVKSSVTGTVLASSAQADVGLGAAQWSKLIARISRLAEPEVPSTPTSAAVADGPGSPAPAAGPLSASLPLSGSPAPAPAAQAGAESSNRPTEGLTAGRLGASTPLVRLAAPVTAPALGALASEPEVVP